MTKRLCGYSTLSKLDNGQLYSIWWSSMLDITHRFLAADLDASPKSLNPVRHDLGNAPPDHFRHSSLVQGAPEEPRECNL